MGYFCIDEEDDYKMHMHVIKTFLRPLPTYLSGTNIYSVPKDARINWLTENYCETKDANGKLVVRDRVQVLTYNDSIYAFITNGKVVEELGLSVLVSEAPHLYVCKIEPEIYRQNFLVLFKHCCF